jgi:uncharacterized protein YceK
MFARTDLRGLAYGEKIPQCYPATYVDGALIGESFTSDNPNNSGAARFFVCIGSVIDLPISLVIDTLILPYDACKSSGQKPSPNTALEPTGVGAGSSAPRSTSQPAGGSAFGR